jgi:hypothetical protein
MDRVNPDFAEPGEVRSLLATGQVTGAGEPTRSGARLR